MMAEADAKLTGRPGVVFVTRGPGAANASSGVHVAQQDSTPLVLFAGQVARAARGRDAFQEVDFAAFYSRMAKVRGGGGRPRPCSQCCCRRRFPHGAVGPPRTCGCVAAGRHARRTVRGGATRRVRCGGRRALGRRTGSRVRRTARRLPSDPSWWSAVRFGVRRTRRDSRATPRLRAFPSPACSAASSFSTTNIPTMPATSASASTRHCAARSRRPTFSCCSVRGSRRFQASRTRCRWPARRWFTCIPMRRNCSGCIGPNWRSRPVPALSWRRRRRRA